MRDCSTSAGLLGCFALAMLGLGCGQHDPGDKRRMVIADSTNLEDLLPGPAEIRTPGYAGYSRFALVKAAKASPAATALGLSPYTEGTVMVDDGEDAANTWRFSLGEDGLRAGLGDGAVAAGNAGLAAAYGPFLHNETLRSTLAGLLRDHRTLSAVDLSQGWDVDNLRLTSLSLSDGAWTDSDGDGAHETALSMLTVTMALPAFSVTRPAQPLGACATLIGDGSSASELAAASGVTWTNPDSASWRWRINLVAHISLRDLSGVHAALWEPTDYPSQGERDAVAHDLGLFAGFLADPAAGLVGSDLVVGVEPDPEFSRSSLDVVAALARTAGDSACLAEVDGWLAEPAVLQPSLTAVQAAGGAPSGYLVEAYSEALDSSDGTVDSPGLLCLHDADGHPLQVGDDAACATPSGPLEIVTTATRAAVAVTPYLRLRASVAGAGLAASGELAHCTSSPWSEMCTGRFGRGIRLCFGEWALRNQVGDYWNLHWYHHPRKAAIQTTIKGAAYLIRGAIFVFFGAEGELTERIILGVASAGSAYVADVVSNFTHNKIAGYSIAGTGIGIGLVLELVFKYRGTIESTPSLLTNFTVGRVVDGLAQMAEVEAVGWQDYSDSSHCACDFEFRDPNYCD